MTSESRKQKIYENLRGEISGRLMRTLDATEADLATLSLGELINTLFLMHGDKYTLGSCGVSFGGALKLVGEKMMWQEPDTKPAVTEPKERIN